VRLASLEERMRLFQSIIMLVTVWTAIGYAYIEHMHAYDAVMAYRSAVEMLEAQQRTVAGKVDVRYACHER
jgi:hypothetical protein